jgi:1-acylglycerone phosphate reductase
MLGETTYCIGTIRCSVGGIGHALSLTYHKAGLRVFASARRLDAMADLAEAGIHTLELDVTNEDSVRSTRERISELTGGTLDILVNNA